MISISFRFKLPVYITRLLSRCVDKKTRVPEQQTISFVFAMDMDTNRVPTIKSVSRVSLQKQLRPSATVTVEVLAKSRYLFLVVKSSTRDN